ncbi:MAG: RNA-binding protein [Ruminococcaceae bacterium]|nr:RNA-binding protein [Oscillospiraceae bacterium]
MTEVKKGSVTVSERGRDKGRIMAVLNVEGRYALVADGRKRKVEKPKRKKLCHLSLLSDAAIEVEGLTNKALWKKLEPYRENDTDSSEA